MTSSQAQKSTPWRQWKPAVVSNAMRQQQARKKLSEFELQTGITREEFEADQRAQRERVRARYAA